MTLIISYERREKYRKIVIIQLPLHLLKFSEKKNAMVELKSGETYNGTLESVDKFMNIKMENAVLSDKVHKLPFRTLKSFIV